MTRSLFFVLLFVLPVFARATELTDLGGGLSYLRVASLNDSAKAVASAIGQYDALVLDLRYPAVGDESVATLRTALASRPAKNRVLVLVSPATPTAVAEALASAGTKCLLLGVKDSQPTPQVIVDQPAATDRLAYDALGADRSLASLTSGKVTKERFDEAALMKEFAGGETPTVADAAKTPTAEAVLIDRVLQRAVHLHRALVALKK